MTARLATLLSATLLAAAALADDFWKEGERLPLLGRVWQTRVTPAGPDVAAGVEKLLAAFERDSRKSLAPGPRRKAVLKLYTASGRGLRTPPELVEAVITALEKRGHSRSGILLLDAGEPGLRDAGYLPPLSRHEKNPSLFGAPVEALDWGRSYRAEFSYESSAPPRFEFGRDMWAPPAPAASNDRLSYLPYVLLNECDFWLNLPMATDHPVWGLSGCLANATLLNISNRERFAGNTANAAAAAAEIAAVPELLGHWAGNLVWKQPLQFIGGPEFQSLYCREEGDLAFSADPVALDVLLLQRINELRQASGFKPAEAPALRFAASLGVGLSDEGKLRVGEP